GCHSCDRASREWRCPDRGTHLLRAFQQRGQLWKCLATLKQADFRVFPSPTNLAQSDHIYFVVGEWSNVDLLSLADKYFYPIGLLFPFRQAEVGTNPKSAAALGTAESQLLPYHRVHAIGPDHERREHPFSSHDQPRNTSVLD